MTRPGATSAPRSRPAIIASAITPEPTVAIVAFESGDIGRNIATPLSRPSTRLVLCSRMGRVYRIGSFGMEEAHEHSDRFAC